MDAMVNDGAARGNQMVPNDRMAALESVLTQNVWSATQIIYVERHARKMNVSVPSQSGRTQRRSNVGFAIMAVNRLGRQEKQSVLLLRTHRPTL